jgi:ribosome-associated translation inhibitor RaiA
MTQGLHNYTMERLQPFLSLMRERARRVRVSLSDQNGPRGGVDKRCLIAISMSGSQTVVIEDTRTDMYSAIDKVSKRAMRSVVRRISRRRNRRGRTSRDAFAELAISDQTATSTSQG